MTRIFIRPPEHWEDLTDEEQLDWARSLVAAIKAAAAAADEPQPDDE